MGLTLTLREGEDFYVQDERIIVERILSSTEFTLRRARDNKLLTITWGRSKQIFRGVFVSTGARGQGRLARVIVEAPRSVPVLRGEIYRGPVERSTR